MKKLFSLVCGIFMLYSATTISASFVQDSDLECQLTRANPSMVVATMEDPSYHDISGLPFSIRFTAKKFGGLKYGIESCFLHTAFEGGFEQENLYEVSMKQINPESASSIYEGKSTFRADAALTEFKIYCPLIAPNVEVEDFIAFITLHIEDKTSEDMTFEAHSPNCKISPFKGIAKKVEVETNVSDKKVVVKITDLRRTLANTKLYVGFTTHSGSVPDATLGTTNDFRVYASSLIVDCTVNGKPSIATAWAYRDYLDISIKTILASGQDHVISCSDLTASIIDGNRYLPSIIRVLDNKTDDYSMGVNTYHFN